MKPMVPSFIRTAVAVAVLAMGPASAALAQEQPSLDLVCYGVGEKLESHYDYDWDRKHHKYTETTSLGTAQVGGSAQVEIHDGQGRVRLPKSLLPPLTTGADGGWFPIHGLSISDDQIRGSLKINGLNKPGLTIDRRSGRMKLDGMESFEGNCNAYNPGSTRF